MKIALEVNGCKRLFSQQELVAILEEYYSIKEAKVVRNEKFENKTDINGFEVNPTLIDQKIFQNPRKDIWQEQTRKWILNSFLMLKEKPQRYGRSFRTITPKKTWTEGSAEELKRLSKNFGHHMADAVEFGFELAQRIHNGETWESVCNAPDTQEWYRIITWQGMYVLVGGSTKCSNKNPKSAVTNNNIENNSMIGDTVPLIVVYD